MSRSAVSSSTGDHAGAVVCVLSLVAMGSPSTGTADHEWTVFVNAMTIAAECDGGLIRPNTLRPMVRNHVAPRRIGAFTNRALSQGLIEPTGEWQVSDDTEGRNGGKPCRVYRWVGGAS